MYIDIHVKRSLILSEFKKRKLSRHIFEKYSKVMKIRPVEAELFRADRPMNRLTYRQTDRQTDRNDKATSRFSQFCERAQKLFLSCGPNCC